MVYFVVSYRLQGRRQFRRLMDVIVGITIAMALVSLLVRPAGQIVDLGGAFNDRQLFGSVLMLLTPILLMASVGMTDAFRRMSAQIATIMTIACLLLTRCRSAWLGTVTALVVLALLTAIFVARSTDWRRRKHEMVWLPVALLSAVVLFVGLSGSGRMIALRAQTLQRVMEDNNVIDRQRLWQGAIRMISARPWLGWGIGTYPVNQTYFTRGSFSADVVQLRGASLHEQAHNEYLQLAAETGVIGLGLHLSIVFAFWLFGLRALSGMENELRKYVLIGCMAALVGKWIDGFANPGWRYGDVSFFNWLALGLGSAAARIGSTAEIADRSRSRAAAGVGAGVRKLGRRSWQSAVCLLVALSVGRVTASSLASAFEFAGCEAAASYTDIDRCELDPSKDVMVPFNECVDYRLLVTFEDDDPDRVYDVTDCPGTVIHVQSWSDPDHCIVQEGPGRFCVTHDAPASCQGQQIVIRGVFNSGTEECESSGCIVPSGVNVSKFTEFDVRGTQFRRLFPADNTLRTVTIRPTSSDLLATGAIVKVLSVTSNSGGFGTQPEIFFDPSDVMEASDPEVEIQLRAALNQNLHNRLYTVTLQLCKPDGKTGITQILIDVSQFPKRLA
jgi:hypothetical protein